MATPQTQERTMFLPLILVAGLIFGFPAVSEYASGSDTQVQVPVVSGLSGTS
jgi:hypothetical protein